MPEKIIAPKKPLFHLWHQYDGHENLKQTCITCGYVRFIACDNHNWETIKVTAAHFVHFGGGDVTVYEQKCKNCGELRCEKLS